MILFINVIRARLKHQCCIIIITTTQHQPIRVQRKFKKHENIFVRQHHGHL